MPAGVSLATSRPRLSAERRRRPRRAQESGVLGDTEPPRGADFLLEVFVRRPARSVAQREGLLEAHGLRRWSSSCPSATRRCCSTAALIAGRCGRRSLAHGRPLRGAGRAGCLHRCLGRGRTGIRVSNAHIGSRPGRRGPRRRSLRRAQRLGTRVERVWIANTDADSRVPVDWLTHQLAVSRTADVCVGTVRPDFDDLSSIHRAHWMSTHTKGQPNGHVHGANLGVRASTYLDAGGFAPIREHEDVDLVARCRSLGAPSSWQATRRRSSRRVASSGAHRVATRAISNGRHSISPVGRTASSSRRLEACGTTGCEVQEHVLGARAVRNPMRQRRSAPTVEGCRTHPVTSHRWYTTAIRWRSRTTR